VPADASWIESMPEVYDRCLGSALFTPYAEHLAAMVADHAPNHVLELAAGTGILTAELVRALPEARITATDLNAPMVAWAAERINGPVWLTADAQHLDFADASFDVVACQFGVMFFPDKPAAFAEAARVLRPDGRLVFTAWDEVRTSDLPAALVDAMRAVLPQSPPDFLARVPYGYHDPDQIVQDVEAGGLAVEHVDRVVLRGHAESARAIAEGFIGGTPLRFALQEYGDPDVLAAQVADEMTHRLGDGPLDGELAAYVISAVPQT
jgi:SAM-dependent methyltransferase